MIPSLRYLVAALALFAGSAFAQGKVQVQWLGHSAFKITTPGGKVIVMDPMLVNNPRTPAEYRKLEGLGKVDLILVTHAHNDHIGDAAALAKLNNARIWGPAGLNRAFLTLGVVPPELTSNVFHVGGSNVPFGPDGPRVRLVQALHASELLWKNPASGKDEIHVGGEASGFIIEFENGFKLWHMGDTALFSDMKLIADLYKPDLILIPIGGGPFSMGPAEAALATREWIRPKAALPIHWGTFPALVGTPEQYEQALGTSSSTKILKAKPGEVLEF